MQSTLVFDFVFSSFTDCCISNINIEFDLYFTNVQTIKFS